MKFLDYLEKRRSYYALNSDVEINDEEIKNIVEKCLLSTPSAFNMQSSCTVLLLNEKSREFWEKVNKIFDNKIDAKKFEGFHNAKGTVLYFINKKIVENLAEKFPAYKENFKLWANHESGMLQNNIWTALRQENIGASLQHYNPVIDDMVKNEYNIDEDWELIAEMPFGNPLAEPDAKDKLEIEKRMKIFK